MGLITDRLIRSAAFSRQFLEGDARDKIAGFILSRQNRDGGFQGRGAESDLYYTMFAVAGLKALGHPIPAFKVWKYAQSFGVGQDLDLVHLTCLIRLRIAFPMFKKARKKLFKMLAQHGADSAYDLFVKLLAEDYLREADFPETLLQVPLTGPTTNIAAALIINRRYDKEAEGTLMSRFTEAGGFTPTTGVAEPDLLSTATAVFALVNQGTNLDAIQKPCIKYAESLWRDSGGFAGHAADGFEDVEYTFYALLTMGCLIQSLASDYGNSTRTQ
ncbi:prenyltransferase/squalene oxidase repeat-containing protein [Pontiella sulfatireligans]|uniref:Prenyltransferase alpha-alpha toroid domain-containing protein n=1 Tax=Pontiella sulfatireligans TaxID=2750658 RepID=A0A6C2UNA4_9BACT|nr:prenyltransferase/squalene oxidase repeat-containing protein [Pontiella sulfatireligans]VGO21760.1 hypothetical protein SCARR_03835 [Pontiella sulfatireligans]